MDLTQEEKQFLLELLNKLTFGIDGIEQAQMAKDIALKLQIKKEQKSIDNV